MYMTYTICTLPPVSVSLEKKLELLLGKSTCKWKLVEHVKWIVSTVMVRFKYQVVSILLHCDIETSTWTNAIQQLKSDICTQCSDILMYTIYDMPLFSHAAEITPEELLKRNVHHNIYIVHVNTLIHKQAPCST